MGESMNQRKTSSPFKKVLAVGSSLSIVLSLVLVGAANPAQAATETTEVTVNLTDSKGAPLSGASASYYGKAPGSGASSWHSFGTTGTDGKTTLAITPGKITLQLTYQNTRQAKNVTVSGATDEINFQTALATVSLKDSKGAPIQGAAPAYYGIATGWNKMDPTDSTGSSTVEVLPSAITFDVHYNSGREFQKVDISGATTIAFQTKAVTLKLEDQIGNPLADGSFSHYGLAVGGWKSHGLSGANGAIETELLSGSYTVAVTYAKKRQQATIVVAGSATGHTFVAEVANPVQPVNPGTGDTGDDGNTGNGDSGNEGNDNPSNEGNQGNESNPGNDGNEATQPGDDNIDVENPAELPGSVETPAEVPGSDETPAGGSDEQAPAEDADSGSDAHAPTVEASTFTHPEGDMTPNEGVNSDDDAVSGSAEQLAKTGAVGSILAGISGGLLLLAGLVMLVISRRDLRSSR